MCKHAGCLNIEVLKIFLLFVVFYLQFYTCLSDVVILGSSTSCKCLKPVLGQQAFPVEKQFHSCGVPSCNLQAKETRLDHRANCKFCFGPCKNIIVLAWFHIRRSHIKLVYLPPLFCALRQVKTILIQVKKHCHKPTTFTTNLTSPSTLPSVSQPCFSSSPAASSCDTRKYIPSTQPSSSAVSGILMNDNSTAEFLEESPCTSACGYKSGSNAMVTISQLQYISEMFPSLGQETISKTLSDSSMNLQIAIEKLLGMTGIIRHCY